MIYLIACLLTLSVYGTALADCEQLAESDYSLHGLMTYINPHDIFEPVEKNTSANDVLEVWDKKSKTLCFLSTFVTDNYHMCFVGGKAIKSGSEHNYLENKCRITIKFVEDKVEFSAKGSLGGGCSTDDLSDQNVCGFNTSIESAVFTKDSK